MKALNLCKTSKHLAIWGQLFVALFLAGCGSAATATPVPTAIPTEVPGRQATVEVGSVTLVTGERAYVPIAIRDITDPDGIGAYDIFITFDPAVVQVAAVFGGDPPFGPGVLPKEEGEQVGSVPIHRINNKEGWVAIVDFQASRIPGPTGDLVVAYLEVEAVGGAGTLSPLGLEVRSLPNATEGVNMATSVLEGSVAIK